MYDCSGQQKQTSYTDKPAVLMSMQACIVVLDWTTGNKLVCMLSWLFACCYYSMPQHGVERLNTASAGSGRTIFAVAQYLRHT